MRITQIHRQRRWQYLQMTITLLEVRLCQVVLIIFIIMYGIASWNGVTHVKARMLFQSDLIFYAIKNIQSLSVLLSTSVPKPLVELHVKLLRKIGKSVSSERWEKYLAKVSMASGCTEAIVWWRCTTISVLKLYKYISHFFKVVSLLVNFRFCEGVRSNFACNDRFIWNSIKSYCRWMSDWGGCVHFCLDLPRVQQHLGLGAREEGIPGDDCRMQSWNSQSKTQHWWRITFP